MVGVRSSAVGMFRALRASLLLAIVGGASLTQGQEVPLGPPKDNLKIIIVEVRLKGLETFDPEEVITHLQSRKGRFFDTDTISGDVRRLMATGKFVHVKPLTLKSRTIPNGVIVIFELQERPTIQYVRYVGNRALKPSWLNKEVDLKVGSPLDPTAVRRGLEKIKNYYQSFGYFKTQVEILEGLNRGDRGVIYRIHEGQSPKLRWIKFVGNHLVSSARLKVIIQSKLPFVWIHKGYVNKEQIGRDVERLTKYYRDLGYLKARVGREINFNARGSWAMLTFFIEEGPRFTVRNVSFRGNKRFSSEALLEALKLKRGATLNNGLLVRDQKTIRNFYGGRGYIYADIEPEPRLLENEPQVDLVYHIREGARFRVAEVKVHIGGENPHTKITTVLNRMSLRPGDIVDTRKIEQDERRLRLSGLFVSNPAQGQVPRIVYNLRQIDDDSVDPVAGRHGPESSHRSQSPDDLTPRRTKPGRWRSNFRGQSPDDLTLTRNEPGTTWYVYDLESQSLKPLRPARFPSQRRYP